jgi:hypothetical protein
MISFVRRWPFWVEFALVVGLAFGYFIFSSVYAALHPGLLFKPHHTNRSLLLLCIVEVVAGALVCLLLWARGWTPGRVGLRPAWGETATGLGLGLICYVAYFAAFVVFALLFPALAARGRDLNIVMPGVPLALALIVPWINGLYE